MLREAPAPSFSAVDAKRSTTTTAMVVGLLKPLGVLAGYYFGFGTCAGYEDGAPTASGELGRNPPLVFVDVTGLQSSSPSRCLLVASNAGGASEAEVRMFEAPGEVAMSAEAIPGDWTPVDVSLTWSPAVRTPAADEQPADTALSDRAIAACA